LVLCGDTPLLRRETLNALIKTHRHCGASCTILSAVVGESFGYGRIIRGIDGDPVAIREEKDATVEEKKILEVNAGVYCFKAESLFKALALIKENKRKKEFYLTDAIEIMADKRWKIHAVEMADSGEALGVNSKVDLAVAERTMKMRILEKFMQDGITIIDPQTTYIDAGTKIGANTVIRPFTVIEADVRIGKDCVIGPFAHLRPQTCVGDRTEIGNFTEVSRSKIGCDCFMKHFSFMGDAGVGNRANIGAGVVTANFDGKNKYKTTIGEDAFIGSDSILVAPVKIGKGAVTGAGCVVAKEKIVPDGHVMVGVPGRVIGKKKT
jgi:bifunctional UDP-N-acetylglucosamine pyrophosphorylase/glucosamine-1-phosphate N-acetyltransferase